MRGSWENTSGRCFAQQGGQSDLIGSAAIPEANRRRTIAGKILPDTRLVLSRRGVLQAAAIDGKSLPMLSIVGLASQHRNDVFRLVGEYGGRLLQSGLGQKECSIGQ